MAFDMVQVASSNLDQVGYDDSAEELHVLFKCGHYYVYFGVPKSVYEELIAAPSVGQYLKGAYEYARQ